MHLPMPDPAPVTKAVLPSRRMTSTPFWHDAVGLRPTEAVLGARTRLVFATDPSRIAEPVHHRENGRIIDLALVGLAARRHRGDLGMADRPQGFFQALDGIAPD